MIRLRASKFGVVTHTGKGCFKQTATPLHLHKYTKASRDLSALADFYRATLCVIAVLVLVLVLQFWCCFVKYDLVGLTLVVIMILKDITFKVLFIVSLFCAWNITTVEIIMVAFFHAPDSEFLFTEMGTLKFL